MLLVVIWPHWCREPTKASVPRYAPGDGKHQLRPQDYAKTESSSSVVATRLPPLVLRLAVRVGAWGAQAHVLVFACVACRHFGASYHIPASLPLAIPSGGTCTASARPRLHHRTVGSHTVARPLMADEVPSAALRQEPVAREFVTKFQTATRSELGANKQP